MAKPSNSVFRLTGALGVDPDPTNSNVEEVLLQGIGFPLRPISGVPRTITPELPDDVIALGEPVQWMGDWVEGKYYPPGAFTRDGNWTAIANTLTLEKPAPVPDLADPATTGLADPWAGVGTQSDVSQISGGQVYTFSKNGWIKELKCWVPELTANTSYRIVIVKTDVNDPDNPITSTLYHPELSAGGWQIVSLPNSIVLAGDKIAIFLESLNSSASTNISGGWTYGGLTLPPLAPPARSWVHDNQRINFRIDKVDLDGTDRSTELEGVIPDSIISVVQTDNVANAISYRVKNITDSGTFMDYEVVLQSETGVIDIDATCTLDIDIPIALATQYGEEVGGWSAMPNWASSVEGFLKYDGVDQGAAVTTAYGVDLLFEPADVSADWDLITTP